MHSQVDSTELQRLLKRHRSPSLDRCDSGSPPPAKRRQQRLATTPTPRPSLDEVSRPSRPQAAPLTPPESSKFSRKRKFEDENPVPKPPNKRRIKEWLRSTRSRRKSCPPGGELEDTDTEKEQYDSAGRRSCPPRLEFEAPDPSNRQRPLLEVLQEMSQSQKQSFGAASIASGRSSRPPTSHADYRKILRNNGILIDHKGNKIPKELRDFLESHILKERPSRLSAEAIAGVVETAIRIADGPEGNLFALADTAMLPINRPAVGRGSNTPWYSDGVPRCAIYPIPLAAPKPDIHLGYPTDDTSKWKIKENAVIDHPVARRMTQPAKGNCFPFFTLELKSEAMGGNLWQAENQAAGSGASCVNATCWLHREATPSEVQSIVDSIAFTACLTHRLVVFHVHFFMPEEKQYYMSRIAACDPLCEVQIQKSNHLTESILEYCLGDRQVKIRKALALLYPFPNHWKNSRPASVMESQSLAADDDDIAGDDASNKTQRTE